MDNQTKPIQGGEQDYQHKLDGVMRRLLEMDNAAIRKLVRQDQQRLTRQRKSIIREIDRALPEEIARRKASIEPEALARRYCSNIDSLYWRKENHL